MSKNPRYDTAQVDDFMRVYCSELPNSPGQSPRVAYNRAEAQYHARHGKKRYANFESFKNCRSRFFKKKRLKNTPKPHTFARTMPHTPADNALDIDTLCQDAAELIEKLQAENAKLREVLEAACRIIARNSTSILTTAALQNTPAP